MTPYKDCFSGYHPLVNFLYFGLVLVYTMCLMNPLCLVISLCSAVIYAVSMQGGRAVRLGIFYVLPAVVVAALVGPVFNHAGMTTLAWLPSGNPLTLESILYGAAAAVMLISVITWFCCYTVVMTSDKFVYLFGRAAPALSLLLSMTLRFVPRLKVQFKRVAKARRSLGHNVSNGPLITRLRSAVTVFSIVLTWSMENAFDTADSMKSRGYGLPGRTAFSLYRFEERDRYALAWLAFCGVYITSGWLSGVFYFCYFPMVNGADITLFSSGFFLCYLALCLTPVIINTMEARKWIHLQSGI